MRASSDYGPPDRNMTASRASDTDFGDPDFVHLAESFGLPAWRCESAADLGRRLRHALTLDVASLVVLPIDDSIDIAISEELGQETVTRT